MSSIYSVNPTTDLVGEFKGQRFALKHYEEAGPGGTLHGLYIMLQSADGAWTRGPVIFTEIPEADVRRLGPVEWIRSVLSLINKFLGDKFGYPSGGNTKDIWQQLDEALKAGFQLRITDDGVELVAKQ